METITCWLDLEDIEDEYSTKTEQEWIFRGQPWGPERESFPLSSSLERACMDLKIGLSNAPKLEKKLIREFASCYHLFASTSPPVQGQTLEWLTIMRHFGTPSRLVDFTWSFFVAAFFAALDLRGDSAIWIVDKKWLGEQAKKEILKFVSPRLFKQYQETRDGKSFRRIFVEAKKPFVSPTNPIRLNERLTVQQGLFLAPGNISIPFMKNLDSMKGHGQKVVTVRIKECAKPDILRRLFRMGTHRSALFPGLSGFAESLREKLLLFSSKRELNKPDIRLEVI